MVVKISNSSITDTNSGAPIDTSWRTNKDLYKVFLKSIQPYKKVLWNLIIIFCFLSVIEILFPFIVKKGVEQVLEVRNWQKFYFYSGIVLILLAISFSFQFIEQYLTINFSTFYSNKVKKLLFRSVANQNIAHINQVSPGQMIGRITFNTNLLKIGLEQWGIALSKQIIFLIGLIVFSLFLNPQFFLITLGITPLVAVIILLIHRSMRHYINNLQTKNAQITEQLYDLFQSWSTIKMFRLEKEISDAFSHYVDEDRHFRVRRTIIYAISHLLIFILTSIITLGLAGLMLKMYLNGDTAYSEMLLYIFYTAYLSRILTQSLRASTYFEAIKIGIITTFRHIPKNLKSKKTLYGKNKVTKGNITLKNLSFFFPGGKLRFKKLNATFKAGSKILLIGKPESGKTCLLQLITGIFTPVGGKVLIDDQEFKSLSKEAITQQIALLSPDKKFLEGSIASNLMTYKNTVLPQSSQIEELIDLLYEFKAGKLASKYKNRLNTKISNQSNLSNNEALLLLGMRALKSKPKIILMDNFFGGADESLIELLTTYIAKNCSKSTIIYTDYKENSYFNYSEILNIENGQILHH